MICSLFNFCPQSAQPVATGRLRRHGEALVSLAPQTKLQAPKMKHETL